MTQFNLARKQVMCINWFPILVECGKVLLCFLVLFFHLAFRGMKQEAVKWAALVAWNSFHGRPAFYWPTRTGTHTYTLPKGKASPKCNCLSADTLSTCCLIVWVIVFYMTDWPGLQYLTALAPGTDCPTKNCLRGCPISHFCHWKQPLMESPRFEKEKDPSQLFNTHARFPLDR